MAIHCVHVLFSRTLHAETVCVLFTVTGSIVETGLEFVVEPQDVVAVAGSSLVWNCSAVSSPGLAAPNITWLKNGRLIGDGRRSVLPSGALSIRRVVQRPGTQDDEDIYECLATNIVGSITSRPVLLRIACMWNCQCICLFVVMRCICRYHCRFLLQSKLWTVSVVNSQYYKTIVFIRC